MLRRRALRSESFDLPVFQFEGDGPVEDDELYANQPLVFEKGLDGAFLAKERSVYNLDSVAWSKRRYAGARRLMSGDVVNRLPNGLDLLGCRVRYLDSE